MVWVLGAALLLGWIGWAAGLDNGLGRTPPMGFNTWNYFGCDINESVVRSTAAKLVSLGLADAGYKYLNLDDCWALHSRDGAGRLQPDPFKFPSGLQALAADVHASGLLFGIYADAGLFTCAGFPGSRFHEAADAAQFASWGVDFLKYDNCFSASGNVVQRYQAMRDALNATGRPIYFSMCEWGVNEPWRWGAAVGNSWRTDADIDSSWDGILRSLDNGAAGLARFAGPGGWNDPDMLEVGNGKLSVAQQRSHFALWSLVKAPLLIGTDLTAIPAASLAILKASEVIAVNQDPLGVAGDIIWKEGPAEVWAGPLAGGARAVVLFNRHWVGDPITLSVTWEQLGLPAAAGGRSARAAVRDLYAGKELGVFVEGFATQVGSNDVAVLKVQPLPARDSTGPLDSLALGEAEQQQRIASADDGWRPWQGAAAAELQARMRDAAAASRRAQVQQSHWQQRQQRRGGTRTGVVR